MDYEKMIERLYQHNEDYGQGKIQNFFQVCLDCKEAATVLQYLNEVVWNAKAIIQGQSTENAKLSAELDRVKREKDALIEAVRGDCAYCKDNGNDEENSPCWHCKGFAAEEFVTGDFWEWRGLHYRSHWRKEREGEE